MERGRVDLSSVLTSRAVCSAETPGEVANERQFGGQLRKIAVRRSKGRKKGLPAAPKTLHLIQQCQARVSRPRTIASFGCVGAISTLTYAGSAILFVEMGAGVVSASLMAYSCGMLVSYWGHRSFTFRSKRPHGEGIPRFVTLSILGSLLAVTIPLACGWLGLAEFVGIVTTALAIPLLSFFGQSRFVFPAPGR